MTSTEEQRPQPTSASPTAGPAVCTANNGQPCKFPFIYKGKTYLSCTRADWARPWCALDTQAGHYNGLWGECEENCRESDGPLRCYHKYSLDDTEPSLRFCSPGQDICVFSYLMHEDGNHYSGQHCSNSSLESWWGGRNNPCTYGDMGGYQCGCDFAGCNFDGETSGFLPIEKRMKMFLFFLFVAAMVLLIVFFFCRCCCCNNKKGAQTVPQPHLQPQQSRRQRKPKASRIAMIIFFIILLYVVILGMEGIKKRY